MSRGEVLLRREEEGGGEEDDEERRSGKMLALSRGKDLRGRDRKETREERVHRILVAV